MPTYEFKNTETDEVFEKFMSYDDKVKFLEDNPRFSRFICFYPQYFVCIKSSILSLVYQRRFGNRTSFVFHRI